MTGLYVHCRFHMCVEHHASPLSVAVHCPIPHETCIIYEPPCLAVKTDEQAARLLCQTLWLALQDNRVNAEFHGPVEGSFCKVYCLLI